MAEKQTTITKNRPDNFTAEATRNGNYFTPRVDIVETESELLLFADMPGVGPEDIDLRYENAELVLRGKVQRDPVKGNLIFGEYDVGDFYRVFQVYEMIDASKIGAEVKNGVLTVHLPKQEQAKPRKVAIKVQSYYPVLQMADLHPQRRIRSPVS
jgi:HSP20 family protein